MPLFLEKRAHLLVYRWVPGVECSVNRPSAEKRNMKRKNSRDPAYERRQRRRAFSSLPSFDVMSYVGPRYSRMRRGCPMACAQRNSARHLPVVVMPAPVDKSVSVKKSVTFSPVPLSDDYDATVESVKDLMVSRYQQYERGAVHAYALSHARSCDQQLWLHMRGVVSLRCLQLLKVRQRHGPNRYEKAKLGAGDVRLPDLGSTYDLNERGMRFLRQLCGCTQPQSCSRVQSSVAVAPAVVTVTRSRRTTRSATPVVGGYLPRLTATRVDQSPESDGWHTPFYDSGDLFDMS
jgi:hypothetical protein